MEAIGRYILSVTVASILLAIAQTLAGKKGSSAALVRLIGGLFLAFTVIRPLADVDLDAAFDTPWDFVQQGSDIAAQGEQITREKLQSIIKQRCEAYILDRANALHAQLEVEVTLRQDDIPVPTAVQLRGSVSPYAKMSLQAWLTDDMGIPKENQKWIG